MGLFSGGLVIGRIFASEIWGAYFREGLLSEFYGNSSLPFLDFFRDPLFSQDQLAIL